MYYYVTSGQSQFDPPPSPPFFPRYTMHGDCRAECRTNVEVRAGEEFTDYYVSPLHGSNYRRASLRDGWFFHCRCERCQGNYHHKFIPTCIFQGTNYDFFPPPQP